MICCRCKKDSDSHDMPPSRQGPLCRACVYAILNPSEPEPVDDLRLCPFCGARPALVQELCGGHGEGNRYVVKCGCGAKVVGSFYQSPQEAAYRWNARVCMPEGA